MMHSFEEVIEVAKVNKQAGISKSSIDEEKLLQAIEQNFPHFKSMQSTPNGYLGKLAFISSILRCHNLQTLTIEQSFDGVIFGNIEDKFKCTILAESYNSDQMVHKKQILNQFENLKEQLEDADESEMIQDGEQPIKALSIFQQKYKIKELYNKILVQLNNDSDAALALTSLFVFELEILSCYPGKTTIAFFDLYDVNNPFDKWFASMKIESIETNSTSFVYSTTLQ